MKKVIVVGSGAGGATIARDLAGSFDVTILEEGRAFRPLGLGSRAMERMKASGLLLDERMTSLLFPSMRIRRSAQGMALVSGRCIGGTLLSARATHCGWTGICGSLASTLTGSSGSCRGKCP